MLEEALGGKEFLMLHKNARPTRFICRCHTSRRRRSLQIALKKTSRSA